MTQQPSPTAFTNYNPAPHSDRHDGWTADRQLCFLETLAETGCISDAATAAGMTARSAYRFRLKPEAENFLHAWDNALTLAATRLTAIAFDRAINGVLEETVKDGAVVSSKRRHSDKLLMFLITHIDAARFGSLSGLMDSTHPLAGYDPVHFARKKMPILLESIEPEEREGFGSDGGSKANDDSADR